MSVSSQKNRTIDIGGNRINLRIRRNPRAKRIILRVDAANDGAVVTLPRRASEREGLELAKSKAGWILQRLAALPPKVGFADGAHIPYLGAEHLVRHRPDARGVVWLEGGEINVAGKPEHVSRRIRDWLVSEARRRVSEKACDKALRLGLKPGKISLRDTRSRWGSCSHNGSISFSWRLVMSPEMVLDYVVAHEVAHLKFMNHGPMFWRTVGELTVDVKTARAWLNHNGERLHRYG